jgi:hypothetical protein
MKEVIKPTTDETPAFIIIGINFLYILIIGFILYLYFLNRISLTITLIISVSFTIMYIPRFYIIKKLQTSTKIKAEENGLWINEKFINFQNLENYKIIKKKPVVVFFFNNKMIIYQEATVHIKEKDGDFSFNVIGSKKIELLNNFLELGINSCKLI